MRFETIFPAWNLCTSGEPPSRVKWLQEQPLSFIGAWEPLSFRKRAGYAYTDEEAFLQEEEFSDTALDRYLAAGANSIVIPYAKGFGLKATAREVTEEQDLILRAHRRGLRVGTYIRVDAVIPELMIADNPDVLEWLSIGMYGRYSCYSQQQTFRKRVCYSHPSAVRWLERLFQYAIEELQADLLHLDGFHISASPWETCRCLHCLSAYRAWLKARFVSETERERIWGIVDFDHIEFPEFEPHAPLPTVLTSPDMQVWYQFLWDKEFAFMRHIRRFVHQTNPDIAVSANPIWNRASNVQRSFCQYSEQFLPWLDAIWVEDHFHLDFVNGQIRSRLGMFKTAREYNLPVCHYHWATEQPKIEASLSLSVAANGGNLSCLGFSFRYLPHFSLGLEIKQRFAAWVKHHWDLLGNTEPYAQIALIRHPASLAWNAREPWLAAMSMEQLLIRMQIPWRLFDTINQNSLSQVRTALLPDMESLSDDEILLLRNWVEGGGRLFFTNKTATHNEYRRRRTRHGILNWIEDCQSDTRRVPALDWYEWSKADATEFKMKHGDPLLRKPIMKKFGEGVLGYWPQIIVPSFTGCTANRWITPGELAPPVNAQDIEMFIRTLHGNFNIEVKGPSSVLAEYAWQPKSKQILIHVICTDPNNAAVDVELDRQSDWAQHQVITPPDIAPPLVHMDKTKLLLRELSRYAVVIATDH